MKIFRVSPAPFHIRAFRAAHRLSERSFAEQIAILRRENLLLPGGFGPAMEAEGFEVFETLHNDAGLQGRWLLENGKTSRVTDDNYLYKILLEQIKAVQPDVIFIYGGALYQLPRAARLPFRSLTANRLLVTGFWGDELPHEHSYAAFFGDMDFIFCSSAAYQKKFAEAGIPASTIGNCFDDSIKYSQGQKSGRFIFSGTTGFGFLDHIGRYEKISEIMRRTDLKIWANEESRTHRILMKTYKTLRNAPRSAKLTAVAAAARAPRAALAATRDLAPIRAIRQAADWALRLKDTELKAEQIFGQAPAAAAKHPQEGYFDRAKSLTEMFPARVSPLVLNGTDYYALVAGAEIVLNLHRDEDADIGNIRCFEATGLGSCLLTDRGEELREFFDVDNDIVAFNTVDECVEKVQHLLSHPEEIRRIAQNGQRATMARHTVRHRACAIAGTLRELARDSVPADGGKRLKRRLLHATYDLNKHPISYDIAYFLQAAEIQRKLERAQDLAITIVWPDNINAMTGVSKEADDAVDANSRAFRIFHICNQMAELMRGNAVINVRNRATPFIPASNPDISVISYPGPEVDHHTAYYRLVHEHPSLITGFSASPDARRYVRTWLGPLSGTRKVLCVTLRQYRFGMQRNSDLGSWSRFLARVDPSEFAIVIVPDTDHIQDFKDSVLGKYPCFEPACFDVDLRFALYEEAYLNMFVNSGPAVASTLDRQVNYLLFRILNSEVPHCTEAFLRLSGFEVGRTPDYATPFQRFVWEDDREEVLWREFCAMKQTLDAAAGPNRDSFSSPSRQAREPA